ncbi:MAG: hypothetical protein FJ279_33690 [Planctomycetes bacterium]|nr:hypothetical protein [Planctomycetota bacterium]
METGKDENTTLPGSPPVWDQARRLTTSGLGLDIVWACLNAFLLVAFLHVLRLAVDAVAEGDQVRAVAVPLAAGVLAASWRVSIAGHFEWAARRLGQSSGARADSTAPEQPQVALTEGFGTAVVALGFLVFLHWKLAAFALFLIGAAGYCRLALLRRNFAAQKRWMTDALGDSAFLFALAILVWCSLFLVLRREMTLGSAQLLWLLAALASMGVWVGVRAFAATQTKSHTCASVGFGR